MASPYANFGTYWNVECRVNALWNTILHQLFGPLNNAVGTAIVIPEDYPLPNSTAGRTMYLSVRRLVHPVGAITPVTVTRPRVVLEGKGANGDSFAEIAEQMELWCAEANLEEDFTIWCIGVRGSQVKFWRWHGVITEITWDAMNGDFDNGHGTLDLTSPANWVDIQAAVVHMANYAP